jgi:A/G-specific adenine glycosylase
MHMNKDKDFSESLLSWYDKNARVMPWRLPPNSQKKPNPYFIWLSEIMLQQTTVVTVSSYFNKFTTKWPNITELSNAYDHDVMASWAGLGYYARARNLLKCARIIVAQYDGFFPQSYEKLIKLPGIGPYTASAILSIAFSRPHAVLDGNVERVISRYYSILDPLPDSKGELKILAQSNLSSHRPGDHNQAIMDLGAMICTPTRPHCSGCPVNFACKAYIIGNAELLPKKLPKKNKPLKFGSLFIGVHPTNGFLLERRAENGLLGGMLGWPSTDWSECPSSRPPLSADWVLVPGLVRHTFTHFNLELNIYRAIIKRSLDPYFFIPLKNFNSSDMPTVMRKAYDLYLISED